MPLKSTIKGWMGEVQGTIAKKLLMNGNVYATSTTLPSQRPMALRKSTCDRVALWHHDQREFEAESVAYVVCCRNGVESHSEAYLADYVTEHTTIDHVDLYQVMRAAGTVERMLGLNPRMKI